MGTVSFPGVKRPGIGVALTTHSHLAPKLRKLAVCSCFDVRWRLGGWVGVVYVWQASACHTDTTPTQPPKRQRTSKQEHTTNVVMQ